MAKKSTTKKLISGRSSGAAGTMPAARMTGYASPYLNRSGSNMRSATASIGASKSAGKATSPTKKGSMVSTTAKMKKRSGR